VRIPSKIIIADSNALSVQEYFVMTEQNNVLILIPTFNESGNIESLYREIRLQVPDVNFLFVDDNSPDGTGQIIDRLAETDPRVFVLHREAKMGVGSAHYAGISWAYDHEYDFLLTMDCDFTHPPKYIKTILQQRHTGDILVGSRFMKKASLAGWNLIRKFLTWTGHALTTNLLGMPYDATGGFRLYNLLTVPRQGFDLVSSLGYSFFFESLFIFHVNGVCIREIPIDLPPRTYGSSKMAFSDVLKSLCLLGEVFFTHFIDAERYRISSPLSALEINPKLLSTQAWDDYWERGRDSKRSLYNFIAAFYRKVLIRLPSTIISGLHSIREKKFSTRGVEAGRLTRISVNISQSLAWIFQYPLLISTGRKPEIRPAFFTAVCLPFQRRLANTMASIILE